MFGLLMEKASGFTQLASSMGQCLDIDGPVHSGRFMVSMKDLLKLLPVTQSLHCTKKRAFVEIIQRVLFWSAKREKTTKIAC
jgi:hypothetical protein